MSTFTPAGSGGAVQTVSIEAATNPAIQAVALTLASTEYSVVIPVDAKQYLLRLKSNSTLQVAYSAGQSGTTFITVPRNCFYAESDLNLTSAVTVYFQSPDASQTVEVLYWT